jgi:hypothetical protein
MRDSSIEVTLEADGELSESSLNQSTLQPESEDTAALPRDHLVGKHAQALELVVYMSISFDIYGVTVHILLLSISMESIHIQHLISALALKHSF